MTFIISLLFVVLMLSHCVVIIPFIRRIREHIMPAVEDFGILSIILHYDVGILLELSGFEYYNPFFRPFLQADTRSTIISLTILIVSPWLFILGSRLVKNFIALESAQQTSTILAKRAPIFYLVVFVVSCIPAIIGYRALSGYGAKISLLGSDYIRDLGLWTIIIYFPLYFLAYFVRQKNSKTGVGLFFITFLFIANVLATLPTGERTTILMPILIISLFTFRITIARMAAICISLVLLASLILPIFRWHYHDASSSTPELLMDTINGDLSRSQELVESIERSNLTGTRIMPYPMAGYVFAALQFVVPRSVAPWKGYSTAAYFTGSIIHADPDALEWGLGVGAIEEIMLNAGILWVVPGLLIYGALMGAFNRLSVRVPSLLIPTRLAPLWMCGYGLPTLMLLFAVMGGVCWICHILFSDGGVPVKNGRTLRFYEGVKVRSLSSSLFSRGVRTLEMR